MKLLYYASILVIENMGKCFKSYFCVIYKFGEKDFKNNQLDTFVELFCKLKNKLTN